MFALTSLEHAIKCVLEGEICASCGTRLAWHLQNVKRASIFVAMTNEFYCSSKCLREDGHRWGYVRHAGLKEYTGMVRL